MIPTNLSPRETEVFAHLLCGDDRHAIADALGITHLTVKVHMNAIFRQLRVRSLGELLCRFRPVGEPDQRYWARLSPAERRVATLLPRGYQNKRIANELGLAEGTVRVHMCSILAALDVHTRTAAILKLYPPAPNGDTTTLPQYICS